VLQGKGILKVNNEVYYIEKDEYYHIKPNTRVFFENKNEETLDILYLADR
jgi:quercetin dioxygenase-like cupin family protein